MKELLIKEATDFIENTMKFSFDSSETNSIAKRMLKCVEFGADWQAKRMYTDEEVVQLLKFINERLPDTYSIDPDEEIDEWLKQKLVHERIT